MSAPKVRHCLKITDLTAEELRKTLDLAIRMKAHPEQFHDVLPQKQLLMLFEKPSLRTRVSFETGMTKLGGHAIMYSVADSPLGKKETIADTAHVLERMVDIVMARLNKRADIRELAANSRIPVINALDDYAHPTQMVADFQCILEHRGTLEGTVMTYVGDIANNVTYDLMRGCALLGLEMRVSGPKSDNPEFQIEQEVLDECAELCKKTGGKIIVEYDPIKAVTGANVIYTDTIISYHISKDELPMRLELFKPYQVTKELMSHADPKAIFLHCLPAVRGQEVTAEVIDGPQSVIFDEAENRLWGEMALMVFLLKGFDYYD